MTNDPVQTIKDEEAKAKKQIAKFAHDDHEKLGNNRIEKEKKFEEYKDELRKKGQASLETAKQNAMKKFKEITEEEERSRSSVMGQAKGKKDEAVKQIVSHFEKHLVTN